MKKSLIIFACFIMASCIKISDQSPLNYQLGGGVFIVNEGTFLAGNGSLSFFSYDSLKAFNDIFTQTNNRPLGDVPNSMLTFGDDGYIVVNNSGKIEVINPANFKSKATITGLVSPRNMALVNESKAYVTSLYSDSLTILNLYTNKISGYVDLGGSSEAIVVNGSLAYVSNWLGGNKIYVVNTLLDKVMDSITVGLEPESMAVDRYNRLWVLCTGGWKKEQKAEIDVINTTLNLIEQKYIFPSIDDSPSCIKADGLGGNIYYLNKGVWRMEIGAAALPSTALIQQADKQTFYKLSVNPANGDILITDVVDYVQNGYLLIHKNDGTFSSKYRLGIIPGSISYSLVLNQVSK